MTTVERAWKSVPPRQPSEAGMPEPDSRGSLRIHDRVVEKVAGHAVTTVPDAAAAPRRVLGMTVGAPRRVGRNLGDDRPGLRGGADGEAADGHLGQAVPVEVRERVV